ncbi:MAG: cystathionine beta-lyase [Parvibaculales bacterium]
MKDETKHITVGRDPENHFGAVNIPVYHASTIIYPNLDALRGRTPVPYSYGRRATPTTRALENAICTLEGGTGCVLTPSGMAAVATAILSVVKSGDHLLMVDCTYAPTRYFCDNHLKNMGIETQYYDPLIGGDIAKLIRDNTALIFCESPGSQTFEIQDIPAIIQAAKKRGVKTALDNTWATPYFFKAMAHGIDLSIQAATKYIVGHADALLGTITANKETYAALKKTHASLGQCAAPDDVFLALRGLRTLPTRLKQHQQSALALAAWLQQFDFVKQVFYPALPEAAGHDLWKRDFEGASGLFGIEIDAIDDTRLAAMLDNMNLFAMGYSWGGFESLIVPSTIIRTASKFDNKRLFLRLHIGLEHVDDLRADLEAGFIRAGFKF